MNLTKRLLEAWDDFWPMSDYTVATGGKAGRNWPSTQDTLPELSGGGVVVYHGTNEASAQSIIQSREIRRDDMNMGGFSTTPSEAGVYASMKYRRNVPGDAPVVVRLVLSLDWFKSAEIHREGGGSGRNQWLVPGGIPSSAILDARVYSRFGERV